MHSAFSHIFDPRQKTEDISPLPDGCMKKQDHVQILQTVEENLSEDEKTNLETDLQDVSRLSAVVTANANQARTLAPALAQLIGTASSETGADISQAEFLKLLASTKPQDPSLKLVTSASCVFFFFFFEMKAKESVFGP